MFREVYPTLSRPTTRMVASLIFPRSRMADVHLLINMVCCNVYLLVACGTRGRRCWVCYQQSRHCYVTASLLQSSLGAMEQDPCCNDN